MKYKIIVCLVFLSLIFCVSVYGVDRGAAFAAAGLDGRFAVLAFLSAALLFLPFINNQNGSV
jgi:hypothetical protein